MNTLERRLTKLEQEANPEMSVADAIRQAIRQVETDREAGITRPWREYVPGQSRMADAIHARRLALGHA